MPSSHYSWETKHQAPTSTTFSVSSWARLVSGGLQGVRTADMEDIKYLFTSCCCFCTERCKGLSAKLAAKSGPALAASALVSKRFVVYLASFLGVSFYFEQSRLVCQKLQRLGTVDDKGLEQYPPKRGKRGDWGRREQGGRGWRPGRRGLWGGVRGCCPPSTLWRGVSKAGGHSLLWQGRYHWPAGRSVEALGLPDDE